MHEIELNVQDKTEKISGTLCLPEEKGSFPLVLMIPGSGDIDRDGNSKYQKLNIYNAIAHSLANNGIASFRYDKRGTGRSDGDFYSTGHFQLVDDARKCLKYLLGNVNIESMFVLGHSEGTIIAPRLVQDSDKVFGIILLCPFIDSFESIMLKQAISIKASARELSGFKRMYINLFFSIIDPVKAQKKLIEKINVTSKETVYSIFQKIPAKWFRELMSVEPKEIYRSVSCPSLIIGGSKDIQCSPDQVGLIEPLLTAGVEAHIIENMSHILRPEPGNPSIFNYQELLKEEIDNNMLALIRGWVKGGARPAGK